MACTHVPGPVLHLGAFILGLSLVQAGCVGFLSFTTQDPDALTRLLVFCFHRQKQHWTLGLEEAVRVFEQLWSLLLQAFECFNDKAT